MDSTMRAFRITGWQQPPELVEMDRPQPGPGQVTVKVAGCGLCHSDLSMMSIPAELGAQMGWAMPFTLGHETAGWIEHVGPGVTDWSLGDAVALVSPAFCGQCRWCRAGRQNLCAGGVAGRGYGADGGLADEVLVTDLAGLLSLGEFDPAVAGPLTDAGATSHHAVARVLPHLQTGADAVAVVIGVGGLGAFVVQLLRALSDATVVAVDTDPARRELALRLGASSALADVDDLGSAVAEAVIDLVGSDATIGRGLRALAPGGAFALVGAAGGAMRRSWYQSLPRDGQVFTFQGSDLTDAQAVIDMAAAGRLQVATVPFPLEQVADAYQALEQGSLSGRIVVSP